MASEKIVLKRSKKLGKVYHPESMLVLTKIVHQRTTPEAVGDKGWRVIGRIADGIFIPISVMSSSGLSIDEKTLELCEKYNFRVDPSMVGVSWVHVAPKSTGYPVRRLQNPNVTQQYYHLPLELKVPCEELCGVPTKKGTPCKLKKNSCRFHNPEISGNSIFPSDSKLEHGIYDIPTGLFSDVKSAEIYKCVICNNICNLTTGSENCGHIFCQKCVLQWMRQSPGKNCPVCRAPLEMIQNLFADIQINQMRLNCIKEPEKCGWNGELQYLEKHLLHDCKYMSRDEKLFATKKVKYPEPEIDIISLLHHAERLFFDCLDDGLGDTMDPVSWLLNQEDMMELWEQEDFPSIPSLLNYYSFMYNSFPPGIGKKLRENSVCCECYRELHDED